MHALPSIIFCGFCYSICVPKYMAENFVVWLVIFRFTMSCLDTLYQIKREAGQPYTKSISLTRLTVFSYRPGWIIQCQPEHVHVETSICSHRYLTMQSPLDKRTKHLTAESFTENMEKTSSATSSQLSFLIKILTSTCIPGTERGRWPHFRAFNGISLLFSPLEPLEVTRTNRLKIIGNFCFLPSWVFLWAYAEENVKNVVLLIY